MAQRFSASPKHPPVQSASSFFCRLNSYWQKSSFDSKNNCDAERSQVCYNQGYHFVLISKICAYFQGQCLTKRECAYF